MIICSQCVMDTTDVTITFDDQGVCSHCIDFEQNIKPYWQPGTQESSKKLQSIVATIKDTQKNQEYDAILGLSGGVDSSYLAYWAKEVGLRILVVHVDAGWNSEIAVQNIEHIVKKLSFDLYTHVVPWAAMRDVQLAFFKSGISNQDIPQDHAFFAVLCHYAVKHRIRYMLIGSNFATESILPTSWEYTYIDTKFIKDICRVFDAKNIVDFPLINIWKRYFYYPHIKRIQRIDPLNYIDYSKEKAIATLTQTLDWKYYGGKHYESRFTQFFQSYWLVERFGFDKRKAHLSSLILAGQLTRTQALESLQQSPYDAQQIETDKEYVAKKLDISKETLEPYFKAPIKYYTDYKNEEKMIKFLIKFRRLFKKK